jgi:hypothetical protein
VAAKQRWAFRDNPEETEAINILLPELKRHIALTELVSGAISYALSRLPRGIPLGEVPPSRRVAVALLIRIENDLRAITLLSVRGYGVQALSLAAAMYEAVYTLAAVGNDDGRAQQWLDHSDERKSFLSAKEATEEAFINIPGWEKLTDRHYAIYRVLCMPKHSNPISLRDYGLEVKGDTVISAMGPNVTEGGLKYSWLAIWAAVRLSLLAVSKFADDHLREFRDDIKMKSEIVFQGLSKLDAEARERWGELSPEKKE